MDPNYLDELKKLKEQKDADMDKLHDVARMSVPNMEESPSAPEEEPKAEEPTEETIKFAPVSQEEEVKTPPPPGGRRARRPSEEEIKKRKKKKKIKLIALISSVSAVAVMAVLLIVYFAVRNANLAEYYNEYWGMGLNIENGVTEYDFFGNIQTMTRFDTLGQPEYVAEFRDGKCIKETKYNADGSVAYYYTHEYDGTEKTLSAYFEDGQMIMSEKYNRKDAQTVQADRTYHKEENRVENAVIKVVDGKIIQREVFSNGVLILRNLYDGVMITQVERFDNEGMLLSRTVNEYNREKQLLLKQTEYDANNTPLSRIVMEYDEKTDLIKKTIRYDSLGEIVDYDTYNYDLNNNPIKLIRYSKDGNILEMIQRVYNDKNLITKETSQKADGTILYSKGYDYDENGFVSRAITYDPIDSTAIQSYTLYNRTISGAITQSMTYNANNVLVEKLLYNEAGFVTENSTYNEQGIMLRSEKTSYDGKQNIAQKDISTFNEMGQMLLFLSEQYDNQGRVTLKTSDNAETGEYEQILCRYTAEGFLNQQTVFDRNGKTLRDETLDAQGRVIGETVHKNGAESEINEYVYNELNQVVQKKHLNLATGERIQYSYTYTEEGLLHTCVEKDSEGLVIAQKTYDDAGFVVEQTVYDHYSNTSETKHFEYDSEGRVIMEETYDNEDRLVTKMVYYYRPTGGFDYTLYGPDGTVLEDSRTGEGLEPDTDSHSAEDSETTDSDTPEDSEEVTDDNSNEE